METLQLSPKETVTYTYDPAEDALSIQLGTAQGSVAREAVAHSSHLSLRRDTQTGEVVGLVVTGVQSLLLERLVRDLFFELRPLLGRAIPMAVSPAESATAPEPAESGHQDDSDPVDRSESAVESPLPAPDQSEEAVAPSTVAAPEPDSAPTAPETQELATDSADTERDAKPEEQAEPQGVDTGHGGAGEQERSTPVTSTAPESSEKPKKRRRRRRRGGRRKKKAAENEQEAAAAATIPTSEDGSGEVPTQTATGVNGTSSAGEESSISMMDGRSAPIPGLDAPESFAFMGLHPHIGQVITVLEFDEPTPIQRRAVPEIMAGNDVIGLSQTGTGKTLAFLVPALHNLIQEKERRHKPKVLVLTPTRELAVQVAEEANTLSMHTDLRITTLYGGARMGRQIRDLKRGVDIIVATPGRLMDHMRRGNVRLNTVEYLVLDEADRMLDMGFLPDVRTILRDLPRKRQTHFFSATMPPPIESLSLEMQQEPVLIEVARQTPAEGIEQVVFPVERHLKLPLLVHLLGRNEEMSSVLVFTETKAEADIVGRKLKEQGVNVVVMHGDLNQRQREQSLGSLSDGSARVLVATNVAARGLDISAISHIVNYDMPQGVDEYVHRIGRTARGAAEGHAFTFVTISDQGMLKRIESALERELPLVTLDDFDYEVETPSWAKPSADQIAAQLTKPATLAERFKSMMGRRR